MNIDCRECVEIRDNKNISDNMNEDTFEILQGLWAKESIGAKQTIATIEKVSLVACRF